MAPGPKGEPIVEPTFSGDGGDLASLDDRAIIDAFRERGLVLFRGFDPDTRDFDALAARFTESYMIGWGRAPFADLDKITLANETTLPLEPHADNGIRPEPQRPDITWFFCPIPADSDGETTVFDGVEVYRALSPETRGELERRKVRYVSRYAPPAWKQMKFASAEAFGEFALTAGAGVYRVDDDGTVEVEVLSAAFRTTPFAGEPAFVSSMCLGGALGFEAMRVTLEGADTMPAKLYGEVRRTLDRCCRLVRWQPGDIMMLDNTRYLHGRRGFADTRRTLYLIQTLRTSF